MANNDGIHPNAPAGGGGPGAFRNAAPLGANPEPIRAPHPTYLVSADLTAEAGSYNGPLTIPIQVVRERLVPALARSADQRTGTDTPVIDGQIVLAQGSKPQGRGLSVSSAPGGRGFVTSYRRYFLSGQQWKVTVRTRDGVWESDREFPSRSAFR